VTLAELTAGVRSDLGETSGTGGFYTDAMIEAAINRAQQVFAFATLCIEKIGTHTWTAATAIEPLTFSDLIVPFIVRIASTGKRLEPSSMVEMQCEDPRWMGREDTAPRRYGIAGWRLMFLYPHTSGSLNLSILYAAAPAAIVTSPEIPERYHAALAQYAIARLRVKEGGAMLQKDLDRLTDFWTQAKECADQVRSRAAVQAYDRVPAEIQIPDFSRRRKASSSHGR
jgi:hypothetical protein